MTHAFAAYRRAFEQDAPFITVHTVTPDKHLAAVALSRAQFWDLSLRAAALLADLGLDKGDRVVHAFDGNHLEDLVFRLASAMLGTVPVTVNWQADTAEQVAYKVQLTDARAAVVAPGFQYPKALAGIPADHLIPMDALQTAQPLAESRIRTDLTQADERIIIFTSGTTGRPKGASHTYRSYQTNHATFDGFLDLSPGDRFAAVVINPLHHANATAVTDWCLRRPGAVLHLLERYTTDFWRLLVAVAGEGHDRIAVPAVSRHFDFLEHLDQTDALPVPLASLRAALSKVTFLLGSAPVGPTTVARLQYYAGAAPTVRFGSTETCLQVMGIPPRQSESARLAAMERGWTFMDGARVGYYIGRPHPPHTAVRVVAGITPGQAGFMEKRPPGEPGYMVTTGSNVMAGYVNNPKATAEVLHDGWYTGLMDIGYYLINPDDGEEDFYWMSRESTLLIRGGANYAYDQINDELKSYLRRTAGLAEADFDLAVVGLKIDSEHEDAACVTLDLSNPAVAARRDELMGLLLNAPKDAVSKGARPDRVRVGPIPRNFKGAVLVPELKQAFENYLRE